MLESGNCPPRILCQFQRKQGTYADGLHAGCSWCLTLTQSLEALSHSHCSLSLITGHCLTVLCLTSSLLLLVRHHPFYVVSNQSGLPGGALESPLAMLPQQQNQRRAKCFHQQHHLQAHIRQMYTLRPASLFLDCLDVKNALDSSCSCMQMASFAQKMCIALLEQQSCRNSEQ